jgi:phage-related tail protein
MNTVLNDFKRRRNVIINKAGGKIVHEPGSKVARFFKKIGQDIKGDWNKVKAFTKKVEKGIEGVVHKVAPVVEKLFNKIGEVGTTALNTAESNLKGIGGLGSSLQYAPFLIAGLIGLVILNADKVGQGAASVRRSIQV